ncbi:flavodoxin [Companilactobacillus sp. HBUAS56275]|jgi:Flavodoxins|uniref:Flavodoxin n=1 Tax=Candidatus Companilactobacillus pullicola TaxID=2838523 RepID=A0A9D2CN97_9LACO|nr:flavodoxin [Candidatus Companilactobacillus pullicola]
MAKLIIYFSLSGNTKKAAERIQELSGADIVELVPQTPYPAGYSNYVPVAQKEFEQQIHPQIKTTLSNLDKYDTIYLGYPTWNGRVPMIFYSLFEKYDFSNKTVIPFTTTGGSSVDESMPYVRKLAATSKVTDGFRYNNNDAQLKKFIEQFD